MFEYLNNLTDSTGDIKKIINKCDNVQNALLAAEKENDAEKYKSAIMNSFYALTMIIKHSYMAANLEEPASHTTPGQITWADRMWGDSPFALWIDDRYVVKCCNDIRQLRNKVEKEGVYDSVYMASAQETRDCVKKLDVCLKAISHRLPKIQISNPGDRHQPCVILLDISGSMNGAEGTPKGKRPIDELNNAIREFKSALESVEEANGCTEICLMTFHDEVEVIQSFRNADRFNLSTLTAGGLTSMNEAIEVAVDVIERQKDIYKQKGVFYYRPWLFLFSDGLPTDDEKESSAKRKLHSAIEGGHVIFFPTSIGGWADKKFLSSYYPESVPEGKKSVLSPQKGEFKAAFRWLSNSLIASVKNAQPTREFKLPDPEGFTIERF